MPIQQAARFYNAYLDRRPGALPPTRMTVVTLRSLDASQFFMAAKARTCEQPASWVYEQENVP